MGIDFRNKKNQRAVSLLAAISVRGGPLLLMAARGGTVIIAILAVLLLSYIREGAVWRSFAY